MTAVEALPDGQCVCGRRLSSSGPSDWACSEPCQSAWFQHQADPDYPHPREIRARVMLRPPTPAPFPGPPPARELRVPDGTCIDVDGQPYVRVGSHWQPAGMWETFDQVASPARYERWCPQCARRVPSSIAGDETRVETLRQTCQVCGHEWSGRTLTGQIEYREAPWPGMRLRLSDGQRSVMTAFSAQELTTIADPGWDRIANAWLRMERQLCGGYADIDQPDDRQQRRRARRLITDWHIHVHANPS